MDAETLRQAMRHWATGVTVVTTAHQGRRHGMTVSSFTSVSLNPPLVLVALERKTRTRTMVAAEGVFAVTVLSQGDQAVSNRFAGRMEGEDRFAGLETFSLVTGAPLLRAGEAWLDCRVVQQVEAGTHTIFIGEVVAARAGEAFAPLLYFNRAYRRLGEG